MSRVNCVTAVRLDARRVVVGEQVERRAAEPAHELGAKRGAHAHKRLQLADKEERDDALGKFGRWLGGMLAPRGQAHSHGLASVFFCI